MTYTLGTAATATGKAKGTIRNAIKKGRLSANQDPDTKEYTIDPSELHRVYPPVSNSGTVNTLTPHDSTALNTIETRVLQVKLEAKDERISDLEKQLEKAEKNGDEWREQAQKLLLSSPQKEKRGFFRRVGDMFSG